MPAPSFSIVIPTFCRLDQLTQCLERVVPGAQMLASSRYEIVVTDDGRDDLTKQMIEARFPSVRWNRALGRGPGANRNAGARVASGEWIVFTDDDCLPAGKWLSSFGVAIAIGCDIYEGRTTCDAGVTSPLYDAPENLHGGWLWSCNFMIRRSTFWQLGGFDESFPHPHMEDTDFRERAKQAGLPMKFVPEAVVDHPPKLRPWGARSGAMQECEILYWYKQGHVHSMRYRLLWNIFNGRMRRIARYRGLESLSAFASAMAELWYVATRVGAWEEKYRAKYSSKTLDASPPILT